MSLWTLLGECPADIYSQDLLYFVLLVELYTSETNGYLYPWQEQKKAFH